MAISQFDLKNFADYIVFGQKRKAVKFQRFQTALIFLRGGRVSCRNCLPGIKSGALRGRLKA